MSLLRRMFRKGMHFWGQVVPRNLRYRPRAAYATAKNYADAHGNAHVRLHPIYPACSTRIEIPQELLDNISSYYNYDRVVPASPNPYLEAVTDYIVAEIPQGRILSDNLHTIAVMTQDGALLGDLSYQYHPTRAMSATENAAMQMRWFMPPRKVRGTVFSMLAGGGSTINYGHWIIDALPRLHLLRQAGLFDEVDYFLVPAYSHGYHRDTLSLLGVPEAKIIVATERMHLEATRLIACSHPRGTRSMLLPGWLIEWHRKSFLPAAYTQGAFSELVYISRKDSVQRNVLNEDEVMAVLAPLGFNSYCLSDLNFEQKVSLFAQARAIVTPSGAGLNTLLYAKPGTSVIEIFPEGMVHAQFYNIAWYLGMQYQFLICRPDQHSRSVREGRQENVQVNINDLRVLLEQSSLAPMHQN